MSILTFNTLVQVENLEKTGLPRDQAAAIVQGQQDAFEHAAAHTLATQSDLAKLGAELRLEMAQLRTELRHDIGETKTDIIKWVSGLMMAQVVVISALVKLL